MPYTIRGRATLSRIAARHGTSLQRLLDSNPRYRANPGAAKVEGELLDQIATPEANGRDLLLRATERMHHTASGYHRVLRVARTIADRDGTDQIRRGHIAEALSFRRVHPDRR